MRGIFQIIYGIVFAASLAVSQETDQPGAPGGEARIGLSVAKPDDTTAGQLPDLPPGIGFVVTKVEADGPAAEAGVQVSDLFWKMDGQMLVNEGQLATLLRLSKPGQKVTISVFREGKNVDLKLTLGVGQENDGEVIRRMLNDSVMRENDGALRIVNIERKTAAITNEKGSAEVIRIPEGDSVRIMDTHGKTIFEGIVRGRPEFSAVPPDWRRQVCAMRRGLDHALSAKAAPTRQPRPRIVPPVSKD